MVFTYNDIKYMEGTQYTLWECRRDFKFKVY